MDPYRAQAEVPEDAPRALEDMTIEELEAHIAASEKRREDSAADERRPFLIQRARDKARVADLEAKHGSKRVWTIDIKGWVPKEFVDAEHEAATLIAIKLPRRSEGNWQRFQKEVIRYRKQEQKSVSTVEQLARVCMAYPSHKKQRELYDATIELAPAAFTVAANLINDLAGGQAQEDEKK